MVIQANDRSSFLQVAGLVTEQISLFPKSTVSVLMGESFGGLLALYVASTLTTSSTSSSSSKRGNTNDFFSELAS